MNNDDENSLFGDYVSIYTRAQAIDDGVLIDISTLAAEYGFRFPVAITQAAWAEAIAVGDEDVGQDETGRTWDVLTCLRYTAKQSNQKQVVYFDVLVSKRGRRPLPVRLKAHCGPGDNGEPVLTVMLPEED